MNNHYGRSDEVRDRGWYREEETFNDREWGNIRRFSDSWSRYRLLLPYEVGHIVARNDGAALEAFEQIYELRKRNEPYEIQQVITTYRSVDGNI